MNKTFAFITVILFLLTAWMSAKTAKPRIEMNLVTSFDFASYPMCGASGHRNCIAAVRFYDADSSRLLADVAITRAITGRQWVVGSATVNSVPRRAYAVTVYLDASGRKQEGPRGPVSELTYASQ